MCWWVFKKQVTVERPSPKIRIKPEQVHIVDGTLQVTGLNGCYVAAIDVTNSMEPVIDDGMFVVIDPLAHYADLIVGDIIYYKSPLVEAIHRIIKIDIDIDGWYCQCQGDNNSSPDPYPVRKEDIQGVWRATVS